ncbi:hypothetical protein [Rosistilla oblonga]|uniref:hypothetical protein n=1 Tax=Rosistilla oblonga TaxID=2527990 RepID=UPI003A9750FF
MEGKCFAAAGKLWLGLRYQLASKIVCEASAAIPDGPDTSASVLQLTTPVYTSASSTGAGFKNAETFQQKAPN